MCVCVCVYVYICIEGWAVLKILQVKKNFNEETTYFSFMSQLNNFFLGLNKIPYPNPTQSAWHDQVHRVIRASDS